MYVCFEGLDQAQQGRFDNSVAAVEAWFTGGQVIGEAVKLFDITRKNRNLPVIKDPHHFIHYQIHKLEKFYSLLDVHEHPHPPKVPDEDIRRAADILAGGYEQQLYAQVGLFYFPYVEARHFTSIKQACLTSQVLQDIMTKYDVTPKYLLRRIHQVVPSLAYSALPMKMELSASQMRARMEYAEWLYQQHLQDPKFLHKVMWGDETRIYVGQDLLGRLKVYHYTGGYDGQPPIANPLLNSRTTFRLDVSLFVDAYNGCTNVEFLTGTTNLEADGRATQGMQAIWSARMQQGLGPYKTMRSKGKKAAKAATREEFADLLTTFLPAKQQAAATRIPSQQDPPFTYLVSVDGASIHKLMKYPDPNPCSRPDWPVDKESPCHLGYAATFLPHPAHSPDIHQVIEHRFAGLKQYLVNMIYQLGFHNLNMYWLRAFVLEYCSSISKETIRADIQNLINCLQVIRTPRGSSVLINGHSVEGVSGGWPPKRFR